MTIGKTNGKGTKGGSLPGEDHPQAKLTNRDVQELRWLHKYRHWSLEELSEGFDISPGYVKLIVYRVRWSHLPDLQAWSNVDGHREGCRGVTNPAAKLTEEDVYEMRRLYDETRMPFSEMAVKFHVSDTHAALICRRQRWTHLPERKWRRLPKNEVEVFKNGEKDYSVQRQGSKITA